MSIENQEAKNITISGNLFRQRIEETPDELQTAISEETTAIRKINLLIGFCASSLATELDKKRAQSKQLADLTWHNGEDNDLALDLVDAMQAIDESIEQLLLEMQKLRMQLSSIEKSLKIHIKHKEAFIG